MPSDSIAGFLDRAQASRVLFPEQVEELIRAPDIPQADLSSLCTYLQAKGVLTQYQSDALRDGRGHELSFGGYPVLDYLGPCRGGNAYLALHPSLRTQLVIRKFAADAFAPADNPLAVVTRARSIGTIHHPHILPVLDAGVFQDQAYAVIEQPANAADLDSLLTEVGGAMPAFLAAEYGWAVASALTAIHERGGCHGEVRPGLVIVTPITIKQNPDGSLRRRPTPNATVMLAETGLIPHTPPASQTFPESNVIPYLPPERLDSSELHPLGDLYGLGATLYLLLTGQPPFRGESAADLLNAIRESQPLSLSALRPDVPKELADLVMRMMAKQPGDRPQSAHEVCQAIANFCRPGVLPIPAPPMAIPMSDPGTMPNAIPVLRAEPVQLSNPDGWGVGGNAFAEAQAASYADNNQPRRRQLTKAEKGRSWLWIIVGLCLHLSAVALLLAWAFGLFDGWSKPDSEPRKDQQQQNNKGKKADAAVHPTHHFT